MITLFLSKVLVVVILFISSMFFGYLASGFTSELFQYLIEKMMKKEFDKNDFYTGIFMLYFLLFFTINFGILFDFWW